MWVGTHIRPRFLVPERYHLPVGISISNEIGYQRPRISADTWTWECRPIVDKKIGRWYGSFNPLEPVAAWSECRTGVWSRRISN